MRIRLVFEGDGDELGSNSQNLNSQGVGLFPFREQDADGSEKIPRLIWPIACCFVAFLSRLMFIGTGFLLSFCSLSIDVAIVYAVDHFFPNRRLRVKIVAIICLVGLLFSGYFLVAVLVRDGHLDVKNGMRFLGSLYFELATLLILTLTQLGAWPSVDRSIALIIGFLGFSPLIIANATKSGAPDEMTFDPIYESWNYMNITPGVLYQYVDTNPPSNLYSGGIVNRAVLEVQARRLIEDQKLEKFRFDGSSGGLSVPLPAARPARTMRIFFVKFDDKMCDSVPWSAGVTAKKFPESLTQIMKKGLNISSPNIARAPMYCVKERVLRKGKD